MIAGMSSSNSPKPGCECGALAHTGSHRNALLHETIADRMRRVFGDVTFEVNASLTSPDTLRCDVVVIGPVSVEVP